MCDSARPKGLGGISASDPAHPCWGTRVYNWNIIIIIIIIISLGSRWDYAHGCGPGPAPGELGLSAAKRAIDNWDVGDGQVRR